MMVGHLWSSKQIVHIIYSLYFRHPYLLVKLLLLEPEAH
jgi:hypothetical protein